MKEIFLILSLVILNISAQNQNNKIQIDWNNMWQFEQISPQKYGLRKVGLERLNKIQGRTGRIIGGRETSPHRLPYQAALVMDFGDEKPVFCGGSLIKPKFVLTAAHCTSGAQRSIVILGAHNVTNELEKGQKRIQLSKYWMLSHRLFWPHTFTNDIGLVQLPEPVELNQFIYPVELPYSVDLNVGQEGLISGWGLVNFGDKKISTMLRHTTSRVIPNIECLELFEFVNENTICTSGEGSRSTCSGDSGGPMVAYINGSPVQFGIASFLSSAGCELAKPSGFTRVANYIPWILEHTASEKYISPEEEKENLQNSK